MAIHAELSNGRWHTFSLAEQMGNIGSEVGRAFSWRNKNNNAQMNSALDRALELFDLTLGDPRWVGRLKEIARARENICQNFFGDNSDGNAIKDGVGLEKYFTQFAIAARLRK